MITENLSTLKINKLTQKQYDRELAAGNIDESQMYLTPDESTAFSSIKVNNMSIVADSIDSTLTLEAGANITLTPDVTNDKITIATSADSVAFTQTLKNGTEVGTITINGTGTKLYAPTNTDTKVTAVGNHYTPTADTTSTLSVDASSTTAATWNSTSLVTGVNIQRDAKGHVTGLTVDSIKMPANPDTNTRYGVATSSDLGLVKSGGDVTVASDGTMSVADDSHNHTKYVKNTDYATTTTAGIIKVGTGLTILDGAVQVYPATNSAISGKVGLDPLTPQYLDYAVKVGITTNTKTLSAEEKASACEWLGALSDVDTFVIDGGTAQDV